MNQPIHASVLRLLYALGRDDRRADLGLVAGELRLSCVRADRVLEELDRAGLIDAERVRLTLAGLAVAVSLPAQRAPTQAPPRSQWRAA
jgi:hypothetical protein